VVKMKGLLIVLLASVICFILGGNAVSLVDLAWENISNGIVNVNAAWIDSRNPSKILIGTDRGVFKTEDGGSSWQAVLTGVNKKTNFIYVDNADKKLIYAACSSGLFFSHNQGKNWKRIYIGKTEEENNCSSIVKLGEDELYLGTQAGIFYSRNNGRVWNKFPGTLGNLPILAMAADKTNRLIYAVAADGAYKISSPGRVERIFNGVCAYFKHKETNSEGRDAEETPEEPGYQVNYVSIDPNNPEYVYLATNQGLFKSEDFGSAWRRLPGFGLLSREVRFITTSPDSVLLAATESGVFAYDEPRPFCHKKNLLNKKGRGKGTWQELSLRLIMQDIRFVTADKYGNIYVAGGTGLFRNKAPLHTQRAKQGEDEDTREPTIQQIQQAAIEYAQVIDINWISAQRRLARLKAILPEFSLDYDKTISTYNNSTLTRFAVGPRDWGISLKWNFSDLIWSEQQRLIDSQVRLLVKLRQDILDEVTRLYFERRRLKSELSSCSLPAKEQEKRLRIEEITALLDALTGGYLSENAEKFDLTE
jgi:photosystem II stability/assembly factor-like uncharacterized protein